jgi:hypothetical protein
VTFDPVPLCIICVRLGPSTPGDYVRARVLVPRNPGVTNVLKMENMDAMNGGVVGVFIAPTTKSGRWEAVCRMAHRTARCASHVSRPLGSDRWSSDRWGL